MKKFLTLLCIILAAAVRAGAISLDECYSLVRENYPLIKQYELTEAMSRFSFENAAMGYVPKITLGGQATYQSDVTAFPEVFESLLQMMGTDMAGLSKAQYKVQLEISQTIWDGGYAKARREAVKAQQEVSKLTLDQDMEALKTRVNQMYFGILVMETNLRASLDMDTLMTANLRAAESAVKNGTALQSDLDNIRVELLTLRQQRRQLESGIRTYKDMLAIMIGRQIPDEETFEIPVPRIIDPAVNMRTELMLFEETFEIPVPRIIDPAVNMRTELMLFDARIREIETQKKMLDVAVMPKFALFAQGWYGKPGLDIFNDIMYDRLSWNGIAGITFKWDISGFYTRKNDLRRIEMSQRSVQLQRDAFKWNTDIQQTQIQKEIDRMYDIKASDDEIVRLRESVRRASESKYRNGVITVNELLRDIMSENSAVIERSRHELELLKNIYDLKVLLNQ